MILFDFTRDPAEYEYTYCMSVEWGEPLELAGLGPALCLRKVHYGWQLDYR